MRTMDGVQAAQSLGALAGVLRRLPGVEDVWDGFSLAEGPCPYVHFRCTDQHSLNRIVNAVALQNLAASAEVPYGKEGLRGPSVRWTLEVNHVHGGRAYFDLSSEQDCVDVQAAVPALVERLLEHAGRATR